MQEVTLQQHSFSERPDNVYLRSLNCLYTSTTSISLLDMPTTNLTKFFARRYRIDAVWLSGCPPALLWVKDTRALML